MNGSVIRSFEGGDYPSFDRLRAEGLQGRSNGVVHRVRRPALVAAPALVHVMRSPGPRIEDGSDRSVPLAALRATRLLRVSLFHRRYQSHLVHEGQVNTRWRYVDVTMEGILGL